MCTGAVVAYSLLPFQQVLLVPKEVGFGSSLGFDGHLLSVGRRDPGLTTSIDGSAPWTYDDATLTRVSAVNSTFSCITVTTHGECERRFVVLLHVRFLVCCALFCIATDVGAQQVFEAPTWRESTVCPSRLLPSTVPDALLNISVGPGSSLPPSESSTPARLWVAGWRMVLTDGLATALAVTLLPAGSSSAVSVAVLELRLRT